MNAGIHRINRNPPVSTRRLPTGDRPALFALALRLQKASAFA